MNRIFFFLLAFTCLRLDAFAQDRCGQQEYMEHLIRQNPDWEIRFREFNKLINAKKKTPSFFKESAITGDNDPLIIPVVVHVVHNVSTGVIFDTNIPEEQIISQINSLTEDYMKLNADTLDTDPLYEPVAASINIKFQLAVTDPNGNPTSGILRVFSNKSSYSINDEIRLKSLSFWPSNQYLNIWVCNLESPFLGYAQFPSATNLAGLNFNEGSFETDGVVMDYQSFGSSGTATSPYNKGRTATHEVAHWLSLLHIWGDATCGDDYVADTPFHEDANLDVSCITKTSNCFGFGPTVDMTQNYMDYSSDACMNLFTEGQRDRIISAIELSPSRAVLANSIGRCAFDKRYPIPYAMDFEGNSFGEDRWKIINYDSLSSFSKSWDYASTGAFGESNSSFFIENDSVYSSVQKRYKDRLISPSYLDFSNAAESKVDFDLAYAFGTTSFDTDSLVISFTEGCNNRWTTLASFSGISLVTTDRRIDEFFPQDNEWKRFSVSLNSLVGKEFVRIAITDYSKGINTLYLDNLNFYKESERLSIKLYPVPSTEKVTVEAIYNGNKDVQLDILSIFAKKIISINKSNTSSFSETIDIRSLPAGVYLVRVIADDETVVKKIIVE